LRERVGIAAALIEQLSLPGNCRSEEIANGAPEGIDFVVVDRFVGVTWGRELPKLVVCNRSRGPYTV
jgi:hypothetical protein